MKSYLIVGGAGGVGSAVVDRLVARGDAVAATVLNVTEASAVEARHEGQVKAHIIDLSDADAALDRVKTIVRAIPSLDAVVICAAISPCGAAELTPLETFRRAYEINCVSAVAVFQAAMPALRKSAGRLVLLGSVGGKAAYPFLSAYVATKFALEALCDVMRREVEPQGVSVVAIQPGAIRTNLIRQQIVQLETEYAALDDENLKRYGALYQSFRKICEDTLAEGASSPDLIAGVVVEALDAEEPATRYAAGADAEPTLEMARNLTDRQIDAAFAQMFTA